MASKTPGIFKQVPKFIDYYIKRYWESYKENDRSVAKNRRIENYIGSQPKSSFIRMQNYLVPSCHKILSDKFKVHDTWAIHDFISASSEPQYSVIEIDGNPYQFLTTGIMDCTFDGEPIAIEVVQDNDYNTKYTFYYSKKMSLEMDSFVSKLKDAVFSNNVFKNRNSTFTGSTLELTTIKETNFNAVYMRGGLKSSIKENSLGYMLNLDELKSYGMKTHRGILLSGPPGCGKTLLARAIATELKGKSTVIWITGSSVERASDIKYLFQMARGMSPTLIVMEDIDGIGQSRESEGRGTNSILSELLTQMDGANDNHGVFIIATTNYPTMVDAALRDRPERFDRHYKVDVPSFEDIKKYIEDKLYKDVSDDIVRKLVGKSFAYVDEVVDTAKMLALKRNKNNSNNNLNECLKDAIVDMSGEKESDDVMVV